jgi:hypothetical protein
MLRQPRRLHGALNRTLHDRFMKMMPARLTRCGVNVATARREDPLPSECRGPGWRLSLERSWKLDPPASRLDIPAVQHANSFQLVRERTSRRSRQHRHAVLAALSAPKTDFARGQIDVLDAKRQALAEAKPGPV